MIQNASDTASITSNLDCRNTVSVYICRYFNTHTDTHQMLCKDCEIMLLGQANKYPNSEYGKGYENNFFFIALYFVQNDRVL